MDLTPYLETLRADLAAAAAPGGSETQRAADLLGHALEASARLALLEALSDAAAEITTRLHGAGVEVRLRGREADLVVTEAVTEPAPEPPALDGGDLARLTLRMPEALKNHVEQAAAAEGISVNAWLVRAVTAAATQPPRWARPEPPGWPAPPAPPAPPGPPGRSGKRITGFAQA
ncbi:HicB-like protein involved in pilus formation [Krasilnikovia cinnamomea]|uniref:HicB-like protein involved in pilus formation n=1 Tax=Krasilnikovia cinnamomea TaxID=349313 RepID=A0A4Q7ZCY4_9ACTN|nr:toxin-antitoxin system HicB family antitoxin [Krasilnikovia cinnamomea]RZU48542.1 HicB-like protein involved in pilus formation [Krasilnikovia cinnamomea]